MEAWWASRCEVCGWPGEGRLCSDCRGPNPYRLPGPAPGIRAMWLLGTYDQGPGRAVRHAKRHANRGLACLLARSWARRIAPMIQGIDVLVPAPSAPLSLARRGFAVAPLLAHALSERTGLPVAHALRRRGGARQASLPNAEARRQNLRGRIRCEAAPPGRILLVDDVVTTGATADACARELLGAGAEGIWLAAVCRVDNSPSSGSGRVSRRIRAEDALPPELRAPPG